MTSWRDSAPKTGSTRSFPTTRWPHYGFLHAWAIWGASTWTRGLELEVVALRGPFWLFRDGRVIIFGWFIVLFLNCEPRLTDNLVRVSNNSCVSIFWGPWLLISQYCHILVILWFFLKPNLIHSSVINIGWFSRESFVWLCCFHRFGLYKLKFWN